MEERSLESRMLATMRESRGEKRPRLAARLGLTTGTYYEYERGKLTPSLALLERAALALGQTARYVDDTREYLQRGDTKAGAAPPSSPGAQKDQELVRLSAGLGAEFEAFHLSMLRRSQRLARAVADREMARVHFPRLLAHPPDVRPALVREEPAFQTWAVGELAAHASVDAAPEDPDEALALAELAVLITELAPGEAAFCSRSQGYARFHLGNAHRAKGRPLEADAEVARAATSGRPAPPVTPTSFSTKPACSAWRPPSVAIKGGLMKRATC